MTVGHATVGHAESNATRLHAVRAAIANASLLVGCPFVYLDLGSNTGMVLRSLFNPEAAPRASLQPHFRQIFGSWTGAERRKNVCAVAFEPNALHTPTLARIEGHFRRQHARIHIFTTTAASTADGTANFYAHPEGPKSAPAWGASLSPEYQRPGPGAGRQRPAPAPMAVESVDFARWLRAALAASRAASRGGAPPTVVVKMDIEGAEYGVASRLVDLDVLCQLRLLLVEFHDSNLWLSMGKAYTDAEPRLGSPSGLMRLAAARGCTNVTVMPLDDARNG